ncbi:MAG TPA: hypothetical protein VFD58_29260 [Blastocatellia bacterium]|nr:hypothetical protein [Blastocatellia bacterium]
MESLLFAVALTLMLVAGHGVFWLIASTQKKVSAPEWWGLAWLYGAAVVALASFVAGALVAGAALRLTLTAICLALGAAGTVRWRRHRTEIIWPRPRGVGDWLLVVVLLVQAGFVAWISLRTILYWDALFNWEMKARLAYFNGGVIPLSYLSGAWLNIGHPEYPLLLPLAESWFYGWIGAPHQGLIKLVSVPFYLAALSLLASGGARIAGRRWSGWLPPLLLFFVPFILFNPGSATSGFADFPLAAYYLGAALALAEYLETGSDGARRILVSLSAILPWLKQEGAILWLCLVALAAIEALRRKRVRDVWLMVLPGAGVIIGWQIFVRIIKAPVGQDFMPFTPATLLANIGRTPAIIRELLAELTEWRRWGVLWPGLVLALPLLKAVRRRQVMTLLLATVLPVAAYQVIYFFFRTADKSVEDHIRGSLPRLLTHVAPLAVLLVALAISSPPGENEEGQIESRT